MSRASTELEAATDDAGDPVSANDHVESADAIDDTDEATAPDREVPDDADSADSAVDTTVTPPHGGAKGSRGRFVTFLALPLLLMVLATGAGYLKYQDDSIRDSQRAAISSVRAATDGTVALLSYTPDTVQAKLTASRDLLTGNFRDAYTSLTNDVVIPGARQKQITATTTVPGVASVSASANHAVVLVFVDQTVVVANDAPTQTASAVQVTLEKSGNRWLISGFDPK